METLWGYSPLWIHVGFAQTPNCLRALVRPLPVGTRAEQDPPLPSPFQGPGRAHCLRPKAPLPPVASPSPFCPPQMSIPFNKSARLTLFWGPFFFFAEPVLSIG